MVFVYYIGRMIAVKWSSASKLCDRYRYYSYTRRYIRDWYTLTKLLKNIWSFFFFFFWFIKTWFIIFIHHLPSTYSTTSYEKELTFFQQKVPSKFEHHLYLYLNKFSYNFVYSNIYYPYNLSSSLSSIFSTNNLDRHTNSSSSFSKNQPSFLCFANY